MLKNLKQVIGEVCTLFGLKKSVNNAVYVGMMGGVQPGAAPFPPMGAPAAPASVALFFVASKKFFEKRRME